MRLLPLHLLLLSLLCSYCSVCEGFGTRSPLFLGFDYGTSGVRCCVITSENRVVFENALLWKDLPSSSSSSSSFFLAKGEAAGKDPSAWIEALEQTIQRMPVEVTRHIVRIAVSGTSASALLYDSSNKTVSRGPFMYDHSVAACEEGRECILLYSTLLHVYTVCISKIFLFTHCVLCTIY